MADVINQYKVYKNDDIYHPITIGYCSVCGEQVSHSQYGHDEECPNCHNFLSWIAKKND